MRKRILALVLALTVSLCPVMTADAAMIVKNNMGALYTSNILDKNKTEIPKDSLQKIAAGYKINYSAEDLEALKKIFDVNIYAKAYPDVAKAYGNDREALWNHYITHGLKEGRTQINPAFNVFAYISAYPDLQNAFGDDLVAYYVHYANYGINENRKLTTIDAVTKAGITVSGMNGQVIAKPAVPESVLADPAEETISVPASVPESPKTESKHLQKHLQKHRSLRKHQHQRKYHQHQSHQIRHRNLRKHVSMMVDLNMRYCLIKIICI